MEELKKLIAKLQNKELSEESKNEIQSALETIIETKSNEKADTLVQEKLVDERQNLVENYEEKFDLYKEDMTKKFSNFVDEVIEEEVVIPGNIREFARKGEIYSDLIEEFKKRIVVDEGVMNAEANELLRESANEIKKLREQLDEKTDQVLTLQEDIQEISAHAYILEKCEGLTASQSKTVKTMLEGISDKDTIDEKFTSIVEHLDIKTSEEEDGVITEEIQEHTGKGKDNISESTSNQQHSRI